jgi:MtN3 and saliva related transmembrane protein
MASLIINSIGVAAAVCSMASFAPQALKIVHDRDASSVSLRMYLVTTSGFILWVFYGILMQSWPLVASNLVCLLLALLIVFLKFRFGEGQARAQQ